MVENKVFAIVTPYYITEDLLSESGDNTGDCGYKNRTQTPLGGVTKETDFSQLEEVIEGTPVRLIKGEAITIKVGITGECGLRLPDYLDHIGVSSFGVQAELQFDGEELVIYNNGSKWDNRINQQGCQRYSRHIANPSENPTIVFLADHFGFNKEQQQNQAVLKIEYQR